MDKETLSNYGWIVICVLVLVVMIALASPFGTFVSEAVQSTTKGLFDVNKSALDAAGVPGLTVQEQEFKVPGMIHGQEPEKVMIEFSIDGVGTYEVEEGTTWADWIASYGVSAGDNGIVWIGYDGHKLMDHGYLYVMINGNALGENQIKISAGNYPRYDDVILPMEYLVDGPM